MKNLVIRNTISSVELVDEINLFRREEGNRSEVRHDTLLTIIRDEFDEEISLQKILESTYVNERGREYPMFELTKSQATQILVRESKFVRRNIVAKLERLEETRKREAVDSLTRRDLALMLIESEDKILELESEIKEMTPKVKTFDKFISTEGLYSNAEAGKILRIGQNRLCRLFREWGVYNKKNIPYQRFIDEGCFQLKVSIVKMGDKEKQFTTTMITPKGMDRLEKKYAAHESAKKQQQQLLN